MQMFDFNAHNTLQKQLLESQLKEKPIAYTKWEKCLKKQNAYFNMYKTNFIFHF